PQPGAREPEADRPPQTRQLGQQVPRRRLTTGFDGGDEEMRGRGEWFEYRLRLPHRRSHYRRADPAPHIPGGYLATVSRKATSSIASTLCRALGTTSRSPDDPFHSLS